MNDCIMRSGQMTFKIGIATAILYFVAVSSFLIFKTELTLTIWELLTVFSAPIVTVVLLKLHNLFSSKTIYKSITTVSMSCTCALTAMAHIVNIAVTRPLIKQGVNVPTYFQIGYWPSVEMAVDYVAWGFFCGLAFLSLALSISHKKIRLIAYICAVICQIGFWGTLFLHESMWYLAPLGYGVGFMILCVNSILALKK